MHLNDKLGIIFVEYNTINEMTKITPKLDEYFLTEGFCYEQEVQCCIHWWWN